MSRSGREAESKDADWVARLNRSVVEQGELVRFREWRQSPENEAAFQRVRHTWRGMEALSDDPEIRAALAAIRPRPRPSRKAWATAAGGAAAVLLAAVLAIGTVRQTRAPTYRTAIGEHSVVRLADGSTVHLDTDSQLEVRLSKTRRDIRLLRGQALFDVAHDRTRPFVVQAGNLEVTATGTRFDVRRDTAVRSRVVLIEGQVQVASRGGPAQRWTLAPGQALDVGRNAPRVPAPATTNVQDATTWTTGNLTFRDAALPDVVAEANRYSQTRIVLADDPRLARLRVAGIFPAGDVDALIGSLSELYSLKSSRPAANVVRLEPGAAT